VQADQLAQFRSPSPRDDAQPARDRKGAAERLHADALTVVGVVIDVALRGCTSLAMAVLRAAAGFR